MTLGTAMLVRGRLQQKIELITDTTSIANVDKDTLMQERTEDSDLGSRNMAAMVVGLGQHDQPVIWPQPTVSPTPTQSPWPSPSPWRPPTSQPPHAPLPSPTPPSTPPIQLAAYSGPIEHIFFHPLVAYANRAFDGDHISQGFDDWFVTVGEFSKIIQSMYDNGYILVGIDDVYEKYAQGENIGLRRKSLLLPSGKKPVILSIDDLNYYAYMQQNGTSNKIIIDDAGRIATLSVDDAGQTVVSTDNEIIPLLDKFVAAHPDFSLSGQKGVIALTGYAGVLGYRTQSGSKNRDAEILAAMPVVEKLKQTGWAFASHGYGHLDARKVSAQTLNYDTQRWLNEVGSIVGDTYVYIFPYGAHCGADSQKISILEQAGFRLLLGVGPRAYEQKIDLSLLATRRHFDGVALRQLRTLNLSFYDANNVIDRSARGR